jgi:hypothetical protein
MLLYQLNVNKIFSVVDIFFELKQRKQIRSDQITTTTENKKIHHTWLWLITDVSLLRVLSMTTKYASSSISSSWICSVSVLSELFTLSCLLLQRLKAFSSFRDSVGDDTGDTGAETDAPSPAAAGLYPNRDCSP